MAVIPRRTELGERRPAPSIRTPDFGTGAQRVAQATYNLGSAVQELGGAADEIAASRDRYSTTKKLVEFEEAWRTEYNNRINNAPPGAQGLTETFQKDYMSAAREFLGSTPRWMKPEIDQQLADVEFSLTGKARQFQTEEAARNNLVELDDSLNTLLNRVSEDPDQWDAVSATGASLIQNAPYLSPIQKQQALEDWENKKVSQDITARLVLGDIEGLSSDLGIVGGDYYNKLERIESGGNPNAKAATSSATGLHQFTEDTWIRIAQRYEPGLMDTHSRSELLALRKNPAISRRMVQHLTNENREALLNAGIPANDATLYLAHFLGSGGAVAVLRAGGDTPVENILSEGAVNANKSILQGKTSRDVLEWAERKMGDTTSLGELSPRYAGMDAAARMTAVEQVLREKERMNRESLAALEKERGDYLDDFDAFVSAVHAGENIDTDLASRFSDQQIDMMIPERDQREIMKALKQDALVYSSVRSRVENAEPEDVISLVEAIDDYKPDVINSQLGLDLAQNRAQDQASLEKALDQIRGEYADELGSYTEALMSGGKVDDAIASRYRPDVIRAMMPEGPETDAMVESVEQASLYSEVINSVHGLPIDSILDYQQALQDSASRGITTYNGVLSFPTEAKVNSILQQALVEDLRARMDDPAKYALTTDKKIAGLAAGIEENPVAYAKATIAKQEKLGIPEASRRVLPEEMAVQLAASMNSAPPHERGPMFNSMIEQWGEYWPDVLNQMKEEDLNPYIFHAALLADNPSVSQRVASLADADWDELREGIAADELRSLVEMVSDATNDFRAVFEAGDPTGQATLAFNELFDVAKGLSLQYYRQSGNTSAAVETAVNQIINDRYTVLNGGNTELYVPKEFDANLVERGLDYVMDSDLLDEIVPFANADPDLVADARILRAATGGVWVTNDMADGAVLMVDLDGAYQVLLRADGEPFGFKYSELAKFGKRNGPRIPVSP